MQASPALYLIWTLAAREAIAADRSTLDPEHVLLALLKLAELPLESLLLAELYGVQAAAAPLQAQLRTEQQALTALLQAYDLLPGPLHRHLQTVLSRGGRPFQGTELHRSPAARQLLMQAEAMAARAGATVLRAEHLLRLLLEDPRFEQLIERWPRRNALAQANALQVRDLTALVLAGRLHPSPYRAVQAQAIARHIRHRRACPMLLIAANEAVVSECIERLPIALAHAPDGTANGKPLSILEIRLPEATLDEVTERLPRALESAAQADVLVLLASGFAHRTAAVHQALRVLQPACHRGKYPRAVLVYIRVVPK